MLGTSQWCFGPFRLDPTTGTLWRDDVLLPLPPKPFAVLAYLVAHAGQVVAKETLLEAVWPDTAVTEGVLKTCLRQIRRVLGETGRNPQSIATLHRRGYRFVAPVMALAPSPPAPVTVRLVPGARRVPEPQITPPAHLVGRDTELAQVRQCWRQACQGVRQVVFVTGEAGIGKTTLVEAFLDPVSATDAVWLGHGQCIEQYGAGEAYLPLLTALGQVGRSPNSAAFIALLRQQAPSWLAQLPALLSSAEYTALAPHSHGTTRDRMLRELADAVEALSTVRPLVLVLEDLHWSDYATLDWLAYVARRQAPARLLILGTYRPAEAVMRAHPIRTVTQELQWHRCCTELLLPALSEAGVAAYLGQRFGTARWPAELPTLLAQRTGGNPLFLVTVVEELVRQAIIVPQPGGWTLGQGLEAVTRGVPERLVQLIDAQLARLDPVEHELVTAASVAGGEFTAAALAASLERALEDVEAGCDALARRGQFLRAQGTTIWPDGTVTARYRFLHELYHEVVYARVSVSRRVRWHRQIGLRLEAGYGPPARERAAELAEHFVRGRDPRRAVQYLHYAGEQAAQRSAHQAALVHLTKGLEVLTTLPDTPERLAYEVALHLALGGVLIATRGFTSPEVEQTYARARRLCQQLGETPQRFSALLGLWHFYWMSCTAGLQPARELAAQLLAVAQDQDDTALLLQAHTASGLTYFHTGDLATALAHLDAGQALYDPQQHHGLAFLGGEDFGMSCLTYGGLTLWLLGYPDQALTRCDTAVRLMHALQHPFSLACAHLVQGVLHQFRREALPIQEHVTALLALATHYGFPHFVAQAPVLQGWAYAALGQSAEGLTQIRASLTLQRTMGILLGRTDWLGLLADVCLTNEQPAEGLAAITEALALKARSGEEVHTAELYRLQGELVLHMRRAAQQEPEESPSPEACFQQALDVARQQHAKSFELRAATSLARLWQSQDKRQAAYALLAPVYEWFTEGFDTVDLQEAQALLEELSQ
jgi:DNA-binding winged helix-turn-helix (wHTH) protein/predicted ATPase